MMKLIIEDAESNHGFVNDPVRPKPLITGRSILDGELSVEGTPIDQAPNDAVEDSAIKEKSTTITIKSTIMKDNGLAAALGGIGLIGGLAYSFKKDSSFWGYLGYGVLFSIIGTTTGKVISVAKAK